MYVNFNSIKLIFFFKKRGNDPTNKAHFPQRDTATKKESVYVYIREDGTKNISAESRALEEGAVYVSFIRIIQIVLLHFSSQQLNVSLYLINRH